MIARWLGACFVRTRKLTAWCIGKYWLSRMKQAGRNITLGEDLHVYGPQYIVIEDDVAIAHRVTLRAMDRYPWTNPPQTFSPEITLKRGCFINNGSQLSCINSITIGENVMIAENCFIADNNHGYEDVSRSIKQQLLESPGQIVIGNDSWIGANCAIVGSIRIGCHCVVGANAVVTKDIPDYSVAVGAPAQVIKDYDRNRNKWVRTVPS